MASGLHRDPRDRRNTCSTRKFSWLRSGTSYESGIKEAQYFIFASQKTEIAKFASDPKLQGFLAEGELGKQYFGQRNFVIYLITADHKVLNEGCEYWDHYWYSVVVQDLATRRIQSYPCKIKTSQETEMSSRKFLEPECHLHWQFLGIWQILWKISWNHRTSTPYRSETNGITERAVRRMMEGTSAVLCCDLAWMKNGWLILWNAIAICEMSKTSWLMGKALLESYGKL